MSNELLAGASAAEKTAYLTAIASIATADNSASEEEAEYLANLATHAGLDEAGQEAVRAAASDASGEQLKPALDALKDSELRYSLITDLIAFAESDNNLAAEEKAHIQSVAAYLGVDTEQVRMLQHYVHTAAEEAPAAAQGIGDIGGLGGIGEQLKKSGINMSSLTKGLLSFVGPMILGNLMSKGMNRSGGSRMGNAGLGGLGNIGSLVSGLTSGRGLSGIGGLLSKLLK